MIGIIGAMDIETKGIKSAMTDVCSETIASIEFIKGKISGKDVVCAMCNPGKVNAAICAQVMILTYNPEIIINSGVAGSLIPQLKVLDVAIGTACVQHDFDLTALGSPKGMVDGVNKILFECDEKGVELLNKICETENCVTGVIATGDQFISGENIKNAIHNNFDAIACEMEGASIAHVCFVNNTRFAALRVISDGADEMDFNTFKVEASNKSVEIIKEFVNLY